MIVYTTVDSPVGWLLMTSDGSSLTCLSMGPDVGPDVAWVLDDIARPFDEAREQLAAYFAGRLTEFDLPVVTSGTPFQERVWAALKTIAYGETVSYGEIARRIGSPSSSRAVGLANAKNPVGIVIPCHRVIGAGGKLTGYVGGLPCKAALLALERSRAGLQSTLF